MEKPGRSRRRFLQSLIGAALGLGFLGRYLRVKPKGAQVLLEVPRGEIPLSGALVYSQSRLALISDGEGLYALSLSCPHLGCTVTVTPQQLVCPCHGSVFDRRGAVLRGPADRPLTRLIVEERGETVVVLG